MTQRRPSYVPDEESPPPEPGDFLELTPITRRMNAVRDEMREQIASQVGSAIADALGKKNGLPEWAKYMLWLVVGGAGAGGVAAVFPFELKETAKTAHEALQKADEALREELNTMRRELPQDIVKALDAREDRRRRR